MIEAGEHLKLQAMALRTLHGFGHKLFSAEMAHHMAEYFIWLLKPENLALFVERWQLRLTLLNLITPLMAIHLLLLSDEIKRQFSDTLFQLLMDERLEIRQLASEKLALWVQRSISLDLVHSIEKKCRLLLAEKLPKHLRAKRKDLETPNDRERLGRFIIRHHAGVLGLSSLVLSTPFEILEWLPDVLVSIARCASEPDPIHQSVRNTLAEFKRTRQNNWEEERLKFTPEQLDVVFDMQTLPHYYA